jgi:flap endonuclease-1
MAVDLGKFISEVKHKISFEELSGKCIAIDAFNTIYQFLSIIRQPDGTPLTDLKGRTTSHLSGLFYRNLNLIEHGIKPVYVFDGIPPHLKRRTLEARMSRRKEAFEAWEKAKAEGLTEEARIKATASTKINKEIIDSSKLLLTYMGIPFIQAPGEGEAQAAYLVRSGLTYALTSQDYDSFLFGAETVIRNFAITGKRKLPRQNIYVNVDLERIYLKDLLERLKLNREQLIILGMLVGTDFNEGIEKIGPKTALKIVSEYKTMDNIMEYVKKKYETWFDVDPYEVINVFEKPDVREISVQEFENLRARSSPDIDSMIKLMCDDYGFSKERITKSSERIFESRKKENQKGIGLWMK